MSTEFDDSDDPDNWLPSGLVFRGSYDAAVTVHIMPSRGARATIAVIKVNETTRANIASIEVPLEYETEPDSYEEYLRGQVFDKAIELLYALGYAKARRAALIRVDHMPVPAVPPPTPTDGRVIEADVRDHVRNLIAVITALGHAGHGYATENGRKLLRAIAGVREVGQAPSSQGFGDLPNHTDNPHFVLYGVSDPHQGCGSYINASQNFSAVRPLAPAMEVLALDDVLDAVIRRHGTELIEVLQRPEFAVMRPPSHGGGWGASKVPLLVRDADGVLHVRYNSAAIEGMTSEAQAAFEQFRAVVDSTDAINTIAARPGSVLVYSNTRCMHRRQPYAPRFDGQDRFFVRTYSLPREAIEAAKDNLQGRIFK